MKSTLAFLTLILVAFSCQKETEDECKKDENFSLIVSFDSTMTDFQFKDSTYWVYMNDASLQLDSQRVVSSENSGFQSDVQGDCSEWAYVHEYRMKVHSYLSGRDFDYFVISHLLYKDTTSAGNHRGRPIYCGRDFYDVNWGDELVETIPSLTLNGNEFTNVKKVWIKVLADVTTYPNLSTHDLYHYYADGIGLIKWEVMDDSTLLESWSIKSWDIVL